MGGGKPSGSTTTVQKADPWEPQQPYLKQVLSEAGRLYGTGVNGGAPSYDYTAYNNAMDAWKKNSGQATVTSRRQSGKQTTGYIISDGRVVDAGSNPNLNVGDVYGSGNPATMPTLDKFAIPGTGGKTNSLLAPAYYPGQMIADQSPETLTAQELIKQRALAGSPITNSASTLLTDTLQGKYLDPATNPGFNQGMRDIADTYRYAVAPQTDAAFGRAGAYGGSAYNEAVQRNQRALSDSLNKYAGDLYDAERTNQLRSMLFAPQMAAQDYADLTQLGNVGTAKEARAQDLIGADLQKYNYNAQLPLNALANYQNLVSGNFGNSMTQSTPYYNNQGAGILGGALGGAQLASSLGLGSMSTLPWASAFGPAGLAGGALLGGLFGGL